MFVLFVPFVQAAGMFLLTTYVINEDKCINDLHALGLLVFGAFAIALGFFGLSLYIGTFTTRQYFLTDLISFVLPAFIFGWAISYIFKNKDYKHEMNHLAFLDNFFQKRKEPAYVRQTH